MAITLAMLTFATPALAEPVRSPAPGSAERKLLLDLVRPHVERDFGTPIEFVVRGLNISGDFAVALLDAQRPGGGRIDIDRTPLANQRRRAGAEDHMVDCCHTEAVLQKVRGRWRVLEAVAGSTDVWYEDWCRRLPVGMCRTSDPVP